MRWIVAVIAAATVFGATGLLGCGSSNTRSQEELIGQVHRLLGEAGLHPSLAGGPSVKFNGPGVKCETYAVIIDPNGSAEVGVAESPNGDEAVLVSTVLGRGGSRAEKQACTEALSKAMGWE